MINNSSSLPPVLVTVCMYVQVSLKLTQVQQASNKVLKTTPLLEVLVMDIDADVTDRKWDTQGSVSLKGVAILDHITPGKVGSQKQNNERGSCGCMYLMMKHACGDSVFSTCVPYLFLSLGESASYNMGWN